MIVSMRRAVFLAAASNLILAAAATAQEAEAPPADPPADRQGVDEIIVTAQKREQSLQDVPIAVAAYNEATLEKAGVDDIKDLIILSPSLNVTSTSNETVTTARIRGVGTVGDNPGLESSVGIVIDGVIRSRNGVSFGDLGEIERIEVLRGPQGTLFGKNTSAGLINIITKRPEYELGGSYEATYGNYDQVGVSGSVTGPLAEDQLAFRLYGGMGKRDGFYDVNSFGVGPRTNGDDYDRDYYTFRGQILFEPNENLDVLFSGDYTERDESCCLAPSITVGPRNALVNLLGGNLPAEPDPFSFDVQANRSTEQLIEDKGVSLEANWDLSDSMTLTSISSYREFDARTGQDSDFSGADLFYRTPEGAGYSFETLTQELRLAGESGPLNWLLGGFYSDENLRRDDVLINGSGFEPFLSLLITAGTGGTPSTDFYGTLPQLIGLGAFQNISADLGGGVVVPVSVPGTPGFAGAPAGSYFPSGSGNNGDRYYQNSESFAVFTNNDWAVTDALTLTLGARYTMENKTATANFDDTNPIGCRIFENAFGPALDFTSQENQLRLLALSQATGVAPESLGLIATVSCLNANRSVFDLVGLDAEREEDELTYTAKASYRFTPDILGYVSYATGYKAGGFNLDRFNQTGNSVLNFTPLVNGTAEYDPSFEEETVKAWEAALKTEWLDNSLLLNLTAFYQQFDNFQLNTFNGLSFFVTSIPEVESTGFEVETLFYPDRVEGLTLQGAVAYNKAEYGEFAPTGLVDVDALSGQQLSLAPEWYVNGSVDYEFDVSEALFAFVHFDGRWVSSYNTGSDLDAAKEQESFPLFNARVGVGEQDRRWVLELFAENLLDEEYYQVAFDAPLQSEAKLPSNLKAFLGAPRTFGVTLRGQF